MATVEQHVEQLVAQKHQLQASVRSLQQLVFALAFKHGTTKNGKVEYRIPKKMLTALEGQEGGMRQLKTGIVVELHPKKED